MKALLNFIIPRKYYERDAAYLALIDSFIQVRQGVFYWLPKFSFGMIGFKQNTGSLQSLIETKTLDDCWIIYLLILIKVRKIIVMIIVMIFLTIMTLLHPWTS